LLESTKQEQQWGSGVPQPKIRVTTTSALVTRPFKLWLGILAALGLFWALATSYYQQTDTNPPARLAHSFPRQLRSQSEKPQVILQPSSRNSPPLHIVGCRRASHNA